MTGRTPATAAGRSSMPCIGSTTTPSVAQVVAPHVLEQLGVVAPLDPDPARRGDPRRRRRPGDRTRSRDRRAAGAGGRRPAQRHRLAIEEEPARLPREVAPVLGAIAQRHGLGAPRHDVAAEPAGAVLDDHPDGDVDLAVARRPPAHRPSRRGCRVRRARANDSSTGTGGDRGTSDRHGDHITTDHRQRRRRRCSPSVALSLAACRAGDDDDASLGRGRRGHRGRRRRRRQPGREAGRRG